MGRSSRTGLPYLVARADAGQYTYHREIPPALAALVVGPIQLPWSNRNRELDGRCTVKISLGTGDKKTARHRWTAVHPQVENLVRTAERSLREPAEAKPHSPKPRLCSRTVRTIADQAYHDGLAADDHGQVEPGSVTPLASILLHLSRRHTPAKAHSIQTAEAAARRIEQRLHTQRIRDRTTWIMDRPIREEELAGSVAANLPNDPRVGERLAPEQVEALAQGIRIGEIDSEVEARLKENNLDLPPAHPDRRAITLAVTRAKLRALQDIGKRDRGAPIETPLRPENVPPQSKPARPPAVPLLSAMPDRWIAMVRPADKQISDTRRYVRLFIGMHGDLPVDQITGSHVRAFRDALLDCPRNAPQHLATASVAELGAWAHAHPKRLKLSRETINHKGVGTIAAMLRQALKDEHIRANPAEGQHLSVKASDSQERRPYTSQELNSIFTTAIYSDPPRIPAGGRGAAAHWLPLLALFTGARLEELGQALVADVRRDGDIHYFEITTVIDDDDAGCTKSLKSDAARRRIPLHSMLIRCGFLDYVAAARQTTAKRLFPELELYRDRTTKNWSRWWGRWMTKHGLTDPALIFHSFRHGFTAELRRLRCDVSIMKDLLGHAQSDTTSGYGRTNGRLHELAELNLEVQRVAYPGLEIRHLRNDEATVTMLCDS